jgi:hypothetical protein
VCCRPRRRRSGWPWVLVWSPGSCASARSESAPACNRCPPRDLVNSALSFGYAILLSEAVTALAAAGLEPAIGLLHTER